RDLLAPPDAGAVGGEGPSVVVCTGHGPLSTGRPNPHPSATRRVTARELRQRSVLGFTPRRRCRRTRTWIAFRRALPLRHLHRVGLGLAGGRRRARRRARRARSVGGRARR